LLKLPQSEERDEQIEALAEPLSPLKRSALERVWTDVTRLRRERDGELKKSSDNLKNLSAHDQAEALRKGNEKQQFSEQTFTAELAKFSAAMPDFRTLTAC